MLSRPLLTRSMHLLRPMPLSSLIAPLWLIPPLMLGLGLTSLSLIQNQNLALSPLLRDPTPPAVLPPGLVGLSAGVGCCGGGWWEGEGWSRTLVPRP